MIYCVADQSNSSVEKAGLLGSMAMRLLPTDDKCRLRGATLEQAIKSDRENGLIPCYVSTGTSTFRLQNANHSTYHHLNYVAKRKFKTRSIKSISIIPAIPKPARVGTGIGILQKLFLLNAPKVITVKPKISKIYRVQTK
jgi:hypothetical protein